MRAQKRQSTWHYAQKDVNRLHDEGGQNPVGEAYKGYKESSMRQQIRLRLAVQTPLDLS